MNEIIKNIEAEQLKKEVHNFTSTYFFLLSDAEAAGEVGRE